MPNPWAIPLTVSFDQVGPGWDACSAVVTPLSQLEKSQFADAREAVLKGAEGATDTDYTKLVLSLIKSHFIKGTMLTFIDDATKIAAIDPSDLDSAPQVVLDLLLAGVLGVIPDPKASSTATETSSTQSAGSEQDSSESNTKTSSSTN